MRKAIAKTSFRTHTRQVFRICEMRETHVLEHYIYHHKVNKSVRKADDDDDDEHTKTSTSINLNILFNFLAAKRAHTNEAESISVLGKKGKRVSATSIQVNVVIVIIIAVRQLRTECVSVCVCDWQGCDLGTIRMWILCFQFRRRREQQPNCI